MLSYDTADLTQIKIPHSIAGRQVVDSSLQSNQLPKIIKIRKPTITACHYCFLNKDFLNKLAYFKEEESIESVETYSIEVKASFESTGLEYLNTLRKLGALDIRAATVGKKQVLIGSKVWGTGRAFKIKPLLTARYNCFVVIFETEEIS